MSRKTRKLMWSVPLIAALAVIGALAAFMTLTPNQTSAQSVPAPGQPQNFEVSAESETIIKLEWDAPDSSTSIGRQTRYRIDHSSDGETWELLSDAVSGQDDEYRHTGLSARQTVYYRMFALNNGGTQFSTVAMSDPVSATTMASTRPDAPERVSANPGDADDVEATPEEQDTERTQITVRWAPPITPDGTTIHQYKVAYAQNPTDLGLGLVRTLDVVSIPTDEDDEVYCGYTGSSGSVAEVGCRYTFEEDLLEHQTWHYQVYALNEDASGYVGTGNPSDTTSAATKDSVLPNFQKGTVTGLRPLGGKEQVHANPFAAVKKGSPGIFLSWNAPEDPEGAPVTDYIVHARPITDIDGEPTTDPLDIDDAAVDWGSGTDNAVIFHDGETTDLLLTDARAELQRAARVAWNADARLAETPTNLRDLAMVGNFEEYFSNLEWQVRVIAVNRVWSRELQRVPQAYAKALQHEAIVSDDFDGTTDPAGVLSGLDDENLQTSTLINASPPIRVSLNELNEVQEGAETEADGPFVGTIAPAEVALQNPVDARTFTAVRHDNTNGGRTRIDLTWTRTNNGAETPTTDDFAPEYRIQYSEDRKTWTPLDAIDATAGHQDFTPALADCNNAVDDTKDVSCTVSHTGLTAGTTYYYRLFAANTPDDTVNDDTGTDGTVNDLHTVFSTSVDANATTVQAKEPGRPTGLTATNSDEDGHTMIDLKWVAPTVDADGEGDGDGYGTIVAYIIGMSNDGGTTWTEKRITAKQAGTPPSYTHGGLKPGEAWRYQVRTVNKGPAEKVSDWSDTATLPTVQSFDPDKPEGLVAEAVSTTAIKLCWNIQSRTPPAAPIDAYLVEYQDGGTWKLLTTVMDNNDDGRPSTYYVDATLSQNQTRTYRIVAQNEPEVGNKARSPESDSVSATTDPAMAPGAPTLALGTVSDSEIHLSWTGPSDDGGADISGWIVEKAYGGSFLDAERTNDDAFTDAQTWWDGLDCEAMVEAVNDDRTADEDTNPFCKMYDGLAEADRMTVNEYFMKRYVVITDPAMTSYMDMNLMAETEYMYRVKAVNAAGAGMWSNTAMATTEATDTAPGVPTAVTAMETSDTEITVTWGSPASDGGADITGYMVQRAYMGADNMMSEWMDVDPTHSGMMMEYMDTGLMPETAYYYRVAAMNSAGMGEYSDGMAMATTEATDTTLGEPSMVAATSSGGTITVEWRPGANAASQVIVAVNASDDTDYCLHVDTSGILAEHECPNLTVGQTYVVLIIALDGQGGYELGNVVSHTAN